MTHEMPDSFRAQLNAALSRPLLLDQRSLEGVRAARGFRPRADIPAVQASMGGEPFMLAGDGTVAVIDVQGPLSQRAWECWMWAGDGYDAIAERVAVAMADRKVNSVLLRLDSPGGEVAGCFEAVRMIRAAKTSADKPLIVYVDELAASAAYALASAADEIVMPASACVGSIGVITQFTKIDKQLGAMGVDVHVIRSGARKADGHPAVAVSDEELASMQAYIDALAGQFATLVAEGRGGDAAKWLGLEAECFLGPAALSVGLADHLGGFDSAVARAQELGAAKRTAGVPQKQGKNMTKIALIASMLGLAATADEDQVVAEAQKQAGERRELLSLTGGADGDEALGAVKGWKISHARVATLEAETKARVEAEEKREREGLVAALRSGGKLTAAMEAELIPTMSLGQLRAFAKTAGPLVPVDKSHKEPTAATGLKTADGKSYEQLTNAERRALAVSDPDLFKAMRDDAKVRKAV